MQAPRAGKPDAVSKVEHVPALRKPGLGVLDSEELHEALGAHAGPAREQALEVECGEMHMARDGGKIRLRGRVAAQVVDSARDALVIPGLPDRCCGPGGGRGGW